MTLVEAQVAPVAPPAPKIAKRKVKAAAKSEKVVKKLVKANAKGKKFPFNIFLTKNTHWASSLTDEIYWVSLR